MIAPKLKIGDEIRVIAPSRSLSVVREDKYNKALSFLKKQGFNVTFSKHSQERDEWGSSSIASRVEDIHDAFLNENVKMVITAIGGFNVNQILEHIDYELIKQNPKILCGYSDITALLNAIYAKTGLITYHGAHFSTFGFDIEAEYTQKAFFDCMMKDNDLVINPSETAKEYTVIQKGVCKGTIIGGNLCTLNLLQGTEFMPTADNIVLFIEDDNIMGDYFPYEFDRNFQSLLQVYGAKNIKGIVFGRFDECCKMDSKTVKRIVSEKVPKDIPVIFGVDFGHIFPMITFPIGGKVRINTEEKVKIKIMQH